MANETMEKPAEEQAAGQDKLDELLSTMNGNPLQQPPIWRETFDNIRDVFFPKKLPPLELTSKPVAVIDIQKGHVSGKATATSVAVYTMLVAFFIGLAYSGVKLTPKVMAPPAQPVDISATPPIQLKTQKDISGGGGGGSDAKPATQGKLPPISKQPIAPPVIPKNDNPKLAVSPTMVLPQDMKFDTNAVNFGDPNAPRAAVASLGSGGGGGIGNGHGAGLGNGTGGGFGGGVYRAGGGATKPVPIFTPEAEYSDEARRNRFQGSELLRILIDEKGNVIDAEVLRPLGMGLDENAKKAVMTWRFKPSLLAGKPVKYQQTVAMDFNIY